MPFDPTGNVPLINSGGEYIGAVGNFISATLQTAGLYAQTEVLRSFGEFFNLLGTLIYLLAVAGALVIATVFHTYKRALYVLVSPAFFWVVLGTTTTVQPTLVRFGDRVAADSKSNQLGLLKDMAVTKLLSDDRLQVSWLFARYDDVVTEVIQSVVGMLINTKNEEDIINDARERAFSRLVMADGMDQGYLRLSALGVMGYCARVTALGTEIAGVDKEINWRTQSLAAREGEVAQETVKEISSYQARKTELLARYNVLKADRKVQLDAQSRNYAINTLGVTEQEASESFSCERVWALVKDASFKQAQAWLDSLDDGYLTPYAAEGSDPQMWKKVRQDVEQAFADNPGQAMQMLAAYILKNTLAQTTNGQLTSVIANREAYNETEYARAYGNIQGHMAKGELLSIHTFLGMVPYLQGTLLFILAMAFPFYAIFLLIPGRVSSFFVWFSLWIWVKSWDVGFAISHLLRKLLWVFVHHDNQLVSQSIDWSSPATVFQAVNDYDPMANVNIVMVVGAAATLGTPFVTAQICAGASTAFSVFRGGLTDMASQFGNNRFRASKQEEINRMNPIVSRNEAMYAMRAAERAGHNSGMTKDGVRRILAGDATMPRHMAQAYLKAKFEYQFSSQQMGLRSEVAMLSGRTMTYSAGTSKGYLNAMLNEKNEKYRVRTAGRGNNIPFLASDNPGSKEANIDVFSNVVGAGDFPDVNPKDMDGD